MSRVFAAQLDPDAVNLCFCESCMRVGGTRRAELRAAALASTRRTIERWVSDVDPLDDYDLQRKRNNETQRLRVAAKRAAGWKREPRPYQRRRGVAQ